MPKTSEMRESKFLKKEDVGAGVLYTVATCVKHNVAMADQPEEVRWCLTFLEAAKPLVLNATNIQLCELIFKSDDTDHWVGHQLVLYTDPNVSYAGKLVGGIRVRAPRVKPAVPKPALRPAPRPVEVEPDFDGAFDEDVAPF